MKKIGLFLLLLIPVLTFGQTQFTRTQLRQGNTFNFKNADLRNNTYTITRINASLDKFHNQIDSMIASFALRTELESIVYNGNSPTTVTVGGLPSGSAISGQTFTQIIQSIVAPYVSPVFTSFSVTGQATTVEVGTTLSGSRTFTWGITENSGVVSTIDVVDITGSTNLLTNTPNDGSQAATITTRQLNTDGSTQQFRGVGHDTGTSPSNFNSSTFTVTGRFLRFYGSSATAPNNSATIRALSGSAFHTSGNSFTFTTGTTNTFFTIALPPGYTLSSVIDTSALNVNITSEFTSSTITVVDAGGSNRSYTVYTMEVDIPYSTSHTFSVTTN